MQEMGQKWHSVLPYLGTVLICILLWLALDVVRDFTGQAVAFGLSAAIFLAAVVLLLLRRR